MRTKLSLLLLVLTAFAGSGAAQADEVARLKAELLEAQRAEGKLLLEKTQVRVRVLYSKYGSVPKSVSNRDVRFDVNELKGTAHTIKDEVYSTSMEKGALIAEETKAGAGFGIVVFSWAKGEPTYAWYDTLKALKDANKQFRFDGTAPITDKGEDREVGEVDVWALYRKEGRTWTYSMAGGMTMKTTVKNVTAESADAEMQIFDGQGKAMGDPNVYTIKFEKPQRGWENPNAPKPPEPKEQKVKCKAGEFDSVSYDDGKTWMMKKYPGIIVKSEHMELIEFNE